MAKLVNYNLRMDRRRQARTVVPATPITEQELRLQARWEHHPNRLDKEGVDTPSSVDSQTKRTKQSIIDEIIAIENQAGLPTRDVENLKWLRERTKQNLENFLASRKQGISVFTGKPREVLFTADIPRLPSQTPKEPWEMTHREFYPLASSIGKGNMAPWERRYGLSKGAIRAESGGQPETRLHMAIVRQALVEGKPVPPEVLAEYPDITKTQPQW